MHICPKCSMECACSGDEGEQMLSEQWAELNCVCPHEEFLEEFGFPLEEEDEEFEYEDDEDTYEQY